MKSISEIYQKLVVTVVTTYLILLVLVGGSFHVEIYWHQIEEAFKIIKSWI